MPSAGRMISPRNGSTVLVFAESAVVSEKRPLIRLADALKVVAEAALQVWPRPLATGSRLAAPANMRAEAATATLLHLWRAG